MSHIGVIAALFLSGLVSSSVAAATMTTLERQRLAGI